MLSNFNFFHKALWARGKSEINPVERGLEDLEAVEFSRKNRVDFRFFGTF